MNRLCPKCRASCNDDQEYCAECGAVLPSLQEYKPPVNTPNPDPNGNDAPTQELPMKWYKFVIYFQLFANAILNFINGFSSIGTAIDYGDTRGILHGLCTIGLGIAALVIRSGLKNFKANAPKRYYGFMFGGVIVDLLFGAQATSYFLGSVIGIGIVVACNVVYFNKRKHLFVN